MAIQSNLNGKSDLVCGGSRGIGLSAAQALAELGAKVTLLSRSADHLGAALKTLKGSGHTSIVVEWIRLHHI